MRREGRFRVWKPKMICECDHPLDVIHPSYGKCLITYCTCIKFRRKKLPNKLHAKRQDFGGRKYDSGLEAKVAADLEYQKRCGEIIEITPQFCVDIVINGIKICRHYVDFRVVFADGTVQLVEAKGMWTRESLMKSKLVEAVYLPQNPGVSYRVRRC